MKKKNNKDKLENLFRSYFNNAEKVDKPTGWNVPSEDVWGNIQKELAKEKKPERRFLYWHWVAAAAVILLFLSVFQLHQSQQQIQELATQLEKNDQAVQQIQSELQALNDKREQENQNLQLPFDKKNLTEEEEDKKGLIPSNFVNITNNTNKETTVFNNNDNNPIFRNVISKQASLISPNHKLGEVFFDVDVKLGYLKNEKDKHAQNNDLVNPLSKKEETLEVVHLLDKKTFPIAQLDIANRKIDWTGASIVPALKKQHRFYLSADYSPVWKTTKNKGFQFGRNEFFPKKEVQKTAYNAGVQVGMKWGKGWSVETGLRFNSAKTLIRHNKIISYKHLQEKLNTNGDYESIVNLQLGSSGGTIETDVSLSRVSTSTVENNTKIKIDIAFSNTLSHLDIPLIVRKEWVTGSLSLSIKAGLLNRFLLDRKFELEKITIDNVSFNPNSMAFRARPISSSNSNYSAHYLAGVGLEYTFQPGLSLYVEPTFIRSMQPIVDLREASLYTQSKMMNIGLKYVL